jgi:hypothetical protein
MTIEQEIAEALYEVARRHGPAPDRLAPHIARALEDAWRRYERNLYFDDMGGYGTTYLEARDKFHAAFVAGLRGNDE